MAKQKHATRSNTKRRVEAKPATGTSSAGNPRSTDSPNIMRYAPIVIVCLLSVGFLLYESVWATFIILGDGALAVVIWIAAVWLGWWAIRPLRLGDLPLRWQIILSAGVGIGLLSLLVLLLGLLGILHRVVWATILGGMVVAYVVQGMIYLRRVKPVGSSGDGFALRADHLLWLPAVPFLLMALLVATIPPGLSWPGEAGGYDVLSYHFGGPKEYWLAGRITPLPHNVYTYFPFNAEMLYLLSFVLRGGPYAGACLAQLLNASLAIWVVAAAWLVGREFGRTEGVIAGLLAATCPWLTYLSGVAYVENGLLLMSMLALAVVVRMWTNPTCRRWPWFLLAGALAGLSCGYKYTAVPMVALPIGMIVTWLAWTIRPRRWLGPVAFVLGLTITLGPWLAKNVAHAGNPVFPLGYQVFGCRDGIWTDAEAAKWDRGHSPQVDEVDVNSRLARLWQRVLAERNYGPALFIAALLGLPAVLGSRRVVVVSCLIILAVQVGVWLLATHLYSRFGVAFIPTLIVLAAAGWSALSRAKVRTIHRAVVMGVLLIGAGANLVYMGGVYYHHTRFADGSRRDWFGMVDAVRRAEFVNRHTPESARLWMVGDGRPFYVDRPCRYHVVFSHDPLAEFARTGPTGRQLLDWFAKRGVTHVCINWSEIRRFRRPGNYGWPEAVNETLFASMRSAGAILAHAERHSKPRERIHEILEVPAQ